MMFQAETGRGIRRFRLQAGVLLALSAAGAGDSQARWAYIRTEAPVERLANNVRRYVRLHPGDPEGYFILGRIHSLAYARDTEMLGARDAPENGAALPGLGPSSIMEGREKDHGLLSGKAASHLVESVRNYRRATQMAPQEAIYFLGLGWMLEQGINHARELGAPPEKEAHKRAGPGSSNSATLWRQQALAAYRRAYKLSVSGDLQKEHVGPHPDSTVSVEAGEGIIRLVAGHARSPHERVELHAIRRSIMKIHDKPHSVTPVIFGLRPQSSLNDLLAPGKTVTFDLAGDGLHARWPWVKEDTGILVWDPARTGRVTSGEQLFGSVTWWIFWKNGYLALSSLDDNHNGWLEGKELTGIAAWFDRNGNGVCDPGEVAPLESLGIDRIAVQSTGMSGNTPFNPTGLHRSDGASLSTYDWTPTPVNGTMKLSNVNQAAIRGHDRR